MYLHCKKCGKKHETNQPDVFEFMILVECPECNIDKNFLLQVMEEYNED